MNYEKTFKSLCTPAQIYFALSVLSILGLLVQNTEAYKYRVGPHSVSLPHHNAFFFVFKALYVLAWTFVLQQLCKKGYKNIAWFFVLLPFIALFVIIGLFLVIHTAK
jgi:hypothetical protein